ncbi:hypothetical protein niasHT_028486 [Heterodera trifolii]|uniref:Lon proteolytic domain-containing protein n=1 Tax=Heterodera trifolii TaxID=157864 RepID=A0ABD2KPS4_9BILA
MTGTTLQIWTLTDHFPHPVVSATLSRLVDVLGNGYVSPNLCSYVIMDEADKMFDMGFELSPARLSIRKAQFGSRHQPHWAKCRSPADLFPQIPQHHWPVLQDSSEHYAPAIGCNSPPRVKKKFSKCCKAGEKFLAVAKVSSIFTYGDITIVPIGRRYDANAWDGVLCAYMHATWLAEVAGNDFFVHNKVTVQIVPRDHRAISGPSGAAAMLCALMSLATGRLCRADTSVTAGLGGATHQLAGVGGLRPKMEAVRDARLGRLLMAEVNAVEWNALSAVVKGEAYVLIAKETVSVHHDDLTVLGRTYSMEAWDGFFAAYVHANTLTTVAGSLFIDAKITLQLHPRGNRLGIVFWDGSTSRAAVNKAKPNSTSLNRRNAWDGFSQRTSTRTCLRPSHEAG